MLLPRIDLKTLLFPPFKFVFSIKKQLNSTHSTRGKTFVLRDRKKLPHEMV